MRCRLNSNDALSVRNYGTFNVNCGNTNIAYFKNVQFWNDTKVIGTVNYAGNVVVQTGGLDIKETSSTFAGHTVLFQENSGGLTGTNRADVNVYTDSSGGSGTNTVLELDNGSGSGLFYLKDSYLLTEGGSTSAVRKSCFDCNVQADDNSVIQIGTYDNTVLTLYVTGDLTIEGSASVSQYVDGSGTTY